MLVHIEYPLKNHVERPTRAGFAHQHGIAVPGDVRGELGRLADLIGMEKGDTKKRKTGEGGQAGVAGRQSRFILSPPILFPPPDPSR